MKKDQNHLWWNAVYNDPQRSKTAAGMPGGSIDEEEHDGEEEYDEDYWGDDEEDEDDDDDDEDEDVDIEFGIKEDYKVFYEDEDDDEDETLTCLVS